MCILFFHAHPPLFFRYSFAVSVLNALHAVYDVDAGSSGSICDLQNLVLDGCSITQPNGAEFDAQSHSVLLNGEVVTYKVVIEPDSYGIQIAGEYVTSLNCKDLSVIDGVDGKISYDPP